MRLIEPRARGAQSSQKRPHVDIATTYPGTPGGIFMRQFWHAIHRSQDLLMGRAKPIRIVCEDYTLYRGQSGAPLVVAYHCPHRRAPLHLGWVEDDAIRCVYHGWKFDNSGQCVHQPAEEAGFARKVSLRTYPTREYMGLVFAYFGEGEPPPFPHFPHRQSEGLIQVWNAEHVPCNYLQSFENNTDEVHVAFTHQPGGSHAKLSADLPIITAEETEWGMLRFGTRRTGKARQTLHCAPNLTRVIVPPLAGMDGVGGWSEIYFSFTPVDDENHLWLITSHVEVTGEEADAYRSKRAEYDREFAAAPPVMDVVRDIWSGKVRFADVTHPGLAVVQDIAVQAGQGRIEDRVGEHLGRSDAGIILWRKILMRELLAIAKGRPAKKWRTPAAGVVPTLGF
jgi:5,5'-dehydrodivanillate O-demethylase oxygenase subunit